jgi:hypothetical protein
MMLNVLRKTRPDIHYGVHIDVRPGTVGVAIVEDTEASLLPRLLYTLRTPTPTVEDPGASDSLFGLKRAMVDAVAHLTKDGMALLAEHAPRAFVERVLLTFSSPYAHTVTRPVVYRQAAPFTVTRTLVGDLNSKAESAVELELHEGAIAKGAGLAPTAREMLEPRVNGYAVGDPYGLSGTSFEFTYVTNFVSIPLIRAFGGIAERLYPHAAVDMRTTLFSYYCAFGRHLADASSYWLVDVTDEAVEIGVVEDDTLLCASAMPWGSRALARAIAKGLSVPAADAMGTLHSAAEGTLSGAAAKRITPYLTAHRDALVTFITQMADRCHMPSRVLVATPLHTRPVLYPLVAEAFARAAADNAPTLVPAERTANFFAGDTDDAGFATGAHYLRRLRAHEAGDPLR